MRRSLSAVLICCCACCLWADDDAEKARQATLQEMRRRAQEMKLEAGPSKEVRQVKLREEPLLRFDDPTREFADGTVWAWVESGRPLALVTVERYEKHWGYELIALTTEPLSLKTPLGQTWQPSEALFEQKVLPDAKVGGTANARRQQGRQLARDFQMAEYLGPEQSRTVLRLIPRPIYEYSDEKSGLLHGAMFAFANGTNPEALLLLEAIKKDDTQQWRFGCAPLSTARVEAKVDDRLQWESARFVQDTRRAYYVFGILADSAAAE